jgi:hypothetical protein
LAPGAAGAMRRVQAPIRGSGELPINHLVVSISCQLPAQISVGRRVLRPRLRGRRHEDRID